MLDFKEFEKILGYEFKNKELCEAALTHSSYSHIHGVENYQRLEFLGDSIVDFLVAEALCVEYPDAAEGELTKMRGAVVSAAPLSNIVKEKGFDKFLKIGAVTVSEKIRSDIFESLCAAIYLDGGLEKAREFVVGNLKRLISQSQNNYKNDYKTALYEKLCSHTIEFKYIGKSGPEHSPIHEVELYIDGKFVSSAKGESKKSAEQQCSKIALSTT
ncbi:MAG: ribonuclease III [Clostridia bacterium]|nr:ribonuclease III [Clostridia bacterium]MDE7329125.1 ribonuclease III [Clostridia bacterium]